MPGEGYDERITELEHQLAQRDAELAVRDARIAELEQRVATLSKQLAELMEKLGRNSRNSHLPPSSDPPGTHAGKRKKSGRKPGGQPGHGGTRRVLLPLEQVDEVINLYPRECENCWVALPEVPDPEATRYQQTELPPVKPHTKEWRCNEVSCPKCRHRTRARYDEKQIPASPFGPRLMAVMVVLTGIYHLSRRKAVSLLFELVGVRVSLGALSAVEARVSEAIAPAVEEAWKRVGEAKVKHTDGTSWRQAGKLIALWTIATKTATVFKILANHTKKTLEPLFGKLTGILVSDRAKELNFWAIELRQICWAHLLRRFVSFSERDGLGGAIGRELIDLTGLLFDYWHDYKAGKLGRETFVARMVPVRQQVERALDRAVAADLTGMSGSCADILDHRAALWTFVDHEGVEPTNNHAEGEIRAFVLWRKRSYGTQSERGNLFAERVMTVAHTARKQKRNVFQFLTACCRAWQGGTRAPLLFGANAVPP